MNPTKMTSSSFTKENTRKTRSVLVDYSKSKAKLDGQQQIARRHPTRNQRTNRSSNKVDYTTSFQIEDGEMDSSSLITFHLRRSTCGIDQLFVSPHQRRNAFREVGIPAHSLTSPLRGRNQLRSSVSPSSPTRSKRDSQEPIVFNGIVAKLLRSDSQSETHH